MSGCDPSSGQFQNWIEEQLLLPLRLPRANFGKLTDAVDASCFGRRERCRSSDVVVVIREDSADVTASAP